MWLLEVPNNFLTKAIANWLSKLMQMKLQALNVTANIQVKTNGKATLVCKIYLHLMNVRN